MIQRYGRGIGEVYKLARLHCTSLHAVRECNILFVGRGELVTLGAVSLIAENVYGTCNSVVFGGSKYGRARRSGLCPGLRRVSKNAVVSNDLELGAAQRKEFAIEVNGNVLVPRGLYTQVGGSLDCQEEHDLDIETEINSLELNTQEVINVGFNEFRGAESRSELSSVAVEETRTVSGGRDFLSNELFFNSQAAPSHRQTGLDSFTETSNGMETLAVWPQMPGIPECSWRIPDLICEVLPLPQSFNLQLQILTEKLGCSIHSRELLLRILVHKSYYLSKMPQSVKEKKLRKPLMSWQRSGTVEDNLMTFADAHAEARLKLALIGDTVLNLVASTHLIRQYPLLSTGSITERRSQLVCNSNLARAWCTLLDLRELVLCDPLLSRSKKASATALLENQMKACADTLEAYIGGLYVEKGLESTLQFVETRLLPLLLLAKPTRNPVTILHDRCAMVLQEKPDYKLIGVDNQNTPNESCRIRVYVKGFRLSTGIGKSQRLARQDAAEKALLKWPEIFGSS